MRAGVSPAGTFVARLLVADDDAADQLTYEIVEGNDAGAFAIDADGAVTVLDPSALGADGNAFELRVRITDDNSSADPNGARSAEVQVRIAVTDANAPPSIEDQPDPVDENSLVGTVVGVVDALDANEPLTYRITSGDPDGVFAIDPVTGEVTVAQPRPARLRARAGLRTRDLRHRQLLRCP